MTLEEMMNQIGAVCTADPPSAEQTLKIWGALSMSLASAVAGNEGCRMDARVVAAIADHGLQAMRTKARELK